MVGKRDMKGAVVEGCVIQFKVIRNEMMSLKDRPAAEVNIWRLWAPNNLATSASAHAVQAEKQHKRCGSGVLQGGGVGFRGNPFILSRAIPIPRD